MDWLIISYTMKRHNSYGEISQQYWDEIKWKIKIYYSRGNISLFSENKNVELLNFSLCSGNFYPAENRDKIVQKN